MFDSSNKGYLNRVSLVFFLWRKSYLFGSPLESSNNGILDFIQVLYTLGAVDQNVGSHGVGAEAPDLPGFSDVIFVLIGQVTTTDLEVLFVGHFTLKSTIKT